MENKIYSLIFRLGTPRSSRAVRSLVTVLLVSLAGLLPARAQDSTACTAQFYVSPSGSTFYFRAVDSITGVQHYWNFGDTTQIGFGNYVAVTHTYSHPGSYAVTHKIINPATGCHDSVVQVIVIAPPPPNCSIVFYYGHDSTRPNTPYWFYASSYLAGAAYDTITWTINGSPVATGDTMSRVLAIGTYNVCANLRTSLGCRSQYCQTIYVTDSVGGTTPPDSTVRHDSTGADSLVSFMPSYPNPTNNQAWLNIHLDNPQMMYIRVYNSMGNQVEQVQVSGYTGNNQVSVPLKGLQSGIYLIQMQYGNTIKRSRIQKL